MKRVFALVLLPILLFTGSASASSLYRCRYDQVARRACCCPGTSHEAAASDVSHAAAVEKACCCDIETGRATPAPSEVARVQPVQVVTPLRAAVLPIATHVFTPDRHVPLPVEEPRGVGPPIILLKRSFQV